MRPVPPIAHGNVEKARLIYSARPVHRSQDATFALRATARPAKSKAAGVPIRCQRSRGAPGVPGADALFSRRVQPHNPSAHILSDPSWRHPIFRKPHWVRLRKPNQSENINGTEKRTETDGCRIDGGGGPQRLGCDGRDL